MTDKRYAVHESSACQGTGSVFCYGSDGSESPVTPGTGTGNLTMEEQRERVRLANEILTQEGFPAKIAHAAESYKWDEEEDVFDNFVNMMRRVICVGLFGKTFTECNGGEKLIAQRIQETLCI